MGRIADRERLIRSLVRLRRAERECARGGELHAVATELERMVGPTVSRALAARLLGVSQTALDRRIAIGDLPVVVTSSGRREMPVHALVDLLDAMEDDGGPRPLSTVLQANRTRAERLDADSLVPRRARGRESEHGHRRAELRSLAYHRAVAQRLDERLVDEARRRLARWRGEGRIDPTYAEAWERILARPLPSVVRAISEDSERARTLRQSSPFAGALSERERRRVLEAVG